MTQVLRRTSRVLAAGLVLALCTAAGPLCAKVGAPQMVPAKSAYTVSIPDAPAFWKAWKGNAVYATFQKAITSPELAPTMTEFNEQLKVIEGALGFKLNGDTMAQVFKSADVYVAPGEMAGQMVSGVVLGIADKEKLAKMLDLAEKAVASAAAPAEPTETKGEGKKEEPGKKDEGKKEEPKKEEPKKEEPKKEEPKATEDKSNGGADTSDQKDAKSEPASGPISAQTYKGVEIKKFAGGPGREFFYAIASGMLVGSNSEEEVRALVDRSKNAETGGPGIGTVEAFKKVEEGLAAREGELSVYINQKQVLEIQKSQANMEALNALLRKFAPADYSGVSLKFNPKSIEIRGYAPLTAEAEGAAWLQKNPGTSPLEIAKFAPKGALLVGATSLLDAKMIHELIMGLLKMSGTDTAQIEEQLKAVETQLGFGIKQDLIPALGNEIAFMLNSVKTSEAMPGVDAGLIIKIQDKAKMQKVLDGIEKFVSTMMAASAGDPSGEPGKKAPAAGFKSEKAGEMTIKFMEIPGVAGYTPCFAIDGDYLIISTTKDAVKQMSEAKAGKGEALTASESYKKLAPSVTITGNAFQYADFAGVWKVAAAVAGQFPAAQDFNKAIEYLKVLQTYGGSSSVKDNAVVSEAVLLFE